MFFKTGDRVKFSAILKSEFYGVGVFDQNHVVAGLATVVFDCGLVICACDQLESAEPYSGKPHPLTKIFQDKMPIPCLSVK